MSSAVAEALKRIRLPRAYESKEEFLDQLPWQIGKLLKLSRYAPADLVLQEEYRQLSEHGVDFRPDLIIQRPWLQFPGYRSFDVFEVGFQAAAAQAEASFAKLDLVLERLKYLQAFFINIASDQTHAARYAGAFKRHLQCFAVRLQDSEVRLRHARFVEGKLVEEEQVARAQP